MLFVLFKISKTVKKVKKKTMLYIYNFLYLQFFLWKQDKNIYHSQLSGFWQSVFDRLNWVAKSISFCRVKKLYGIC